MRFCHRHVILLVTSLSLATGSASSAAVAAASVQRSPFVTVCGTQLCLNGSVFKIKGATGYGQYQSPAGEISLTRSGGLNTLELDEFDAEYQVLADTEASDTWNRVDAFIAAAHAAQMHVILDLSEYGQSLQAAGFTMSSANWQQQWNQYLSFIANRVNTVSGLVYKDDPTIAMVELWGEIPAPNYGSPVGTAAQIAAWYQATLTRWQQLAPRILVSSGGFSYTDDPGSGIPWQTVYSYRANAVCDLELNSYGDRNVSVPEVTNYCHGIGKPWFLSGWSACSVASQGSFDISDWLAATPAATDAGMASHIRDMYSIASGGAPATYAAIGSDFWNLGTETYNTCDLNPGSPESPSQSWAAVQAG